MTYVRLSPFGNFGAWYDTLSFDRHAIAEWGRGLDSSLSGSDDMVLAKLAQSEAQGGGFVAGGFRMCLSNTPGGQTEPLRSSDQPCPPGSGGMPGEQVQEIQTGARTFHLPTRLTTSLRPVTTLKTEGLSTPVKVGLTLGILGLVGGGGYLLWKSRR